jgi:hypothetical protein
MCRLRTRHFLTLLATLLACGAPEPGAPERTVNNSSGRPFARCMSPDGPATSNSDAGTQRTALLGPEETTDAGPPKMPLPGADLVVASLRPEFRRCYQAGLSVDSLMQGCVIIAAQISPAGGVVSHATIRREGLSPAVEACLENVVARAQFAAAGGGGGGSTLNIPITFLRR